MDSIIQENKECYFCGSQRNLQSHHIFGAAMRNKSENYGLKVWLCFECHTGSKGVHRDKEKMDYLHQIGQQYFEKTYDEDFIKVFGRNYL